MGVIDETGRFVYPTQGINDDGQHVSQNYFIDEVGRRIIQRATTSVTLSDSGSGAAQTVTIKAILPTLSDAGTGTSTVLLGGHYTIAETGHGTEKWEVTSISGALKYVDEIGQIIPPALLLNEMGQHITASRQLDEVGRRVIGIATSNFSVPDSGHGTEAVSVVGGAHLVSDSGVGSDMVYAVMVSTKTVAITETGHGQVCGKILFATYPGLTDSGHGADNLFIAKGGVNAPSVPEFGHGVDSVGVTVQTKANVTDSGTGADAVGTLQISSGPRAHQLRVIIGDSSGTAIPPSDVEVISEEGTES